MAVNLKAIADFIDAKVTSSASDTLSTIEIEGVASLVDARQQHISFIANPTYSSQLDGCAAAAVIVTADDKDRVNGIALVVDNPYLAFARVTQLFDDRPSLPAGIHASASIASSAVIGADVAIAENVVIGEHVEIGSGCEIGSNSVIGEHTSIGNDGIIAPNVTIYHNVVIGQRVRIHSGSVIGADGFGFAPHKGGWEKIAQLGGVEIGDDCEIGANTCIDRGALANTVIGSKVIIDNLVQIAHNVELGDGCALAACAGVAGSSKLGKGCTVAGGAGIAGHLNITDGVHIGPMALISKSIRQPGAYGSGTAQMPMSDWRRSATRFRQLDSMAKRIQVLEKKLQGKVDDEPF